MAARTEALCSGDAVRPSHPRSVAQRLPAGLPSAPAPTTPDPLMEACSVSPAWPRLRLASSQSGTGTNLETPPDWNSAEEWTCSRPEVQQVFLVRAEAWSHHPPLRRRGGGSAGRRGASPTSCRRQLEKNANKNA